MKRYLMSIVMAGFMIVASTACFTEIARSDTPPSTEKLVIVSKDGTKHSFDVEIAATNVDREVGLMYRDHMDPDHGMLFEMDTTDITRFWMKNTLIPLDMLFVAPDGTIKTIHENAVPQSLDTISSEVPVSGVIELNGGRVKALGIAIGDKVIHPFFHAAAK